MEDVSLETYGKISDAVARAKEFNLCLRRIWAVAASLPEKANSLPALIPPLGMFSVPGHGKQHHEHEQCTFDFCEHSRLDFTSVPQHHEDCKNRDCGHVNFYLDRLNDRVLTGKPTAWKLDGETLLDESHSYMAISHVWADGTGAGTWGPGKVNKCLYKFFGDIAKDFQCTGIWWDTISIPTDDDTRNKALGRMHNNYSGARITLVHDLYLREWKWVDAETACFAIVMSPWFSRGWTSLELAKSHKVKILFKATNGKYIVKDLDIDILSQVSSTSRYHGAAESIRKLRRVSIQTLDEILTILGPRDTSKPRDVPTISGLLAGVDVSGGLSQQEIYQRILRKVGNVAQGHLFHNSATMSAPGFSWCPTNILDMPLAEGDSTILQLQESGDLVGGWRVYPIESIKSEDLIWKGAHPLTKVSLETALSDKSRVKHLLLVEKGRPRSRALLVQPVKGEMDTPTVLCCNFVGPVYFLSVLGAGTREDYREAEVKIGKTQGLMEPIQDAWDHVCLTVGAKAPAKPASKDTAASTRGGSASEAQAFLDEGGPVSLTSKTWKALFYSENLEAGKGVLDDSISHHVSEIAGNMLLRYFEHSPEKSRGFWYGTTELVGDVRTWLTYNKEFGNKRQTMLLVLDEDDKIKEDLADTATTERLKGDALLLAANRAAKEATSRFEPLVTLLLHNKAPQKPDSSGRSPLHLAVEHEQVEIIKKLLSKYAGQKYVEETDDDGRSALHIAAKIGNEEIAKLLVESLQDVPQQQPRVQKGSKLDGRERIRNWTALHWAAEGGFPEIVQLLLNSGADPNIQDLTKNTPLHCAARNGHHEVLKVLLKSAANTDKHDKPDPTAPAHVTNGNDDGDTLRQDHDKPDSAAPAHLTNGNNEEDSYDKKTKLDIPNSKGETALHLAAQEGHIDAVDVLLDHGAEATPVEPNAPTALRLAAKNGTAQIVQKLLTKRPGSFNNEELNNALLLAAEGLHMKGGETYKEVIESLHNGGAISGLQNSAGLTALHCTIQAKDSKNAKLLITNQVEVDVKGDVKQRTALLMAVDNGLEDVVTALLNKKADVNTCDSDERTALHLAAIKRNVNIIKLLLKSDPKPRVNSPDCLGRIALHWAAVSGSGTATQTLLDADAHHTHADKDGRTPLILAAGNGLSAAVQPLLIKGGDRRARDQDGKTALDWAATIGSDRIVHQLLEDIGTDSDEAIQNALDLAAKGRHLMAAMMIQRNIKDPAHHKSAIPTILFAAAASRDYNPEVGDFISKNHVDVNLQNERGQTALMLAATHRNMHLVNLLIFLKAEPNLKDRDGKTALMIAAQRNDYRVVGQLLDRGADPNLRDVTGYTALHFAVDGRAIKSFDILVERADLNIADSRKRTVLHMVLESLSDEPNIRSGIWEYMLDGLMWNDLRLNLQDEKGQTAIHLAILKNRQDIADEMLRTSNIQNLDVRDDEGRTPLLLAAERQFSFSVRRLLRSGFDPNVTDRAVQTPLLLAAANGDEESVRELLRYGANTDLPDARGRTPLSVAAQNGHKDVVKLLLEKNSGLDTKDGMGRTALLLAAENGHLSVVEMLLEKNANPNIVDSDGKKAWQKAMDKGDALVVGRLLDEPDAAQDIKAIGGALLLASRRGWAGLVGVLLDKTAGLPFQSDEAGAALNMASMRGHHEVVQILIKKGIGTVADKDNTALIQATLHGFESIVRLLLAREEVKGKIEGWKGSKALLFAAEKGYEGIARLLLENNVNCDVTDSAGRTAMALAAANGNANVVELLVKSQTTPNAKDDQSWTALHHAAWGGYEKVVVLLKHYVDFSCVDQLGQSALHLAAERAATDVVKELLEKRVNPNMAAHDGQTALHRAAWGGSCDVVDLLRQNGADPSIRDKSNNKPWQVAAEKGHETIVDLLVKGEESVRGERISQEAGLIFAAKMGYVAIAHSLLEKGAEAAVRDDRERTPLHWAAERGDKELVLLLLQYGKESINALDHQQRTPLSVAVQNERALVVDELLNGGADVNIRGQLERTALHEAAHSGNWEIVRILVIKHKADPHARDKNWKKAWQLAAEQKFHQIVALLLKKEVDLDPCSQMMEELFLNMAMKGSEPMVNLLLEIGVDVNAKDELGRVAIGLAAERGYDAILEMLLKSGADPGIPDSMGQTPLLWAAKANNVKVISQILDHVKKSDSEPSNVTKDTMSNDIAENSTTRSIETANAMSKIINHPDSEGRTALMIATENNHESAVRVFLEEGSGDINVNATDLRLRTALHLAVERDNNSLVKLLLDYKAEQDCKDKMGRTPLLLAAGQSSSVVVKTLLTASSDCRDMQDLQSRTALHVAIERGCKDIVAELLVGSVRADIQDHRGRTALLLAVERGDKKAVDQLLEHVVNQGGKDGAGRTPLLLAIANGDLAIVKTLLSRDDADLTVKDAKNRSALRLAVESGNKEVTWLIAEKMEMPLD